MDDLDHRNLGMQLKLWHLQEDAPGMVFWHPRGYAVYRVLEDYVRRKMRRAGYAEVRTPQLLPQELWDRSGHWDKFGEHMFRVDDGELVMERQYRYPLRRHMIEIPAGKIDPGEDPFVTARRELKEETGYTASSWRHLATIHIAIAYSNERIEIYLARGLRHEGAKLDDEEFLEVFTLPLATALRWVAEGKIRPRIALDTRRFR